jgi:hypothetical protein
MSALSIQVPFPVFAGTDGLPLENGYVWIGVANLNPQVNPIAVYWDAALTILASQPLRTLNGYVSRSGTPAQVYIDGVNFSILVQDSKGSMVYNFPDGSGISSDASGIVYNPAGTEAVATTVQTKLRQTVSVFDFMTAAEIADVQARTLTLDVTDALQNCADYCLYLSPGNIIYLPSGAYKTSRPWQLGYGVNYGGTPYVSVHVIGEGLTRAPNNGAQIVPTFSNAPCVVLQGVVGAKLEGFSILGKNYSYIYASVLTSFSTPRTTIDQRVVSNWIDPTLGVNANSQYAPYAGIAIDPYSNAANVAHYPDVVYPAFLGAVSQYNKVQGSFSTFENMLIQGFVDAISVAPNGDTGQSDFVAINRCWIQANVYALNVSGPNARVTHFNGVYVSDGFAAIANAVRGGQQGRLEGANINSGFDRLMYWMAPGTLASFGRELSFTGCHGENLWSLGDWAGNANRNGTLTIDGCDINFAWQSYPHIGKPAYDLKLDVSPCNLRGTNFWGLFNIFRISGDAIKINISKCYFEPSDATAPTQLYQKAASQTAAYVHIFQTGYIPTKPSNFDVTSPRYYGFDGNAGFFIGVNRTVPSSGNNSPLCMHLADQYVGGKMTSIPTFVNQVSKSALASVSLTGTTLTFTYTGRSTDDFELYGPAPGDMMYDNLSGSIFYVRARTGADVTAELQNNYSVNSGVVTLINPFSTSTDYMWFIPGRTFSPTTFLMGDFSTATANITNCGIANQNSIFIGEIQAGHRLYTNVFNTYYVSNGPNNTKVASVNTGTGVIAMSGSNMGINATKQQLAFWVIPPFANV